MRGIRTGDQTPSMPASKNVGWRPLVMQTFMHSPHFTQRVRNCFSSREPGGRISLGSDAPACLLIPVILTSGTATRPDNIIPKTLLLPRSMEATGEAADCVFFKNPNRTAFWGQRSSQFMQTRHSVLCQFSFLSGEAFPWQSKVQAPHELQPSLACRVKKEWRERRPRSAP